MGDEKKMHMNIPQIFGFNRIYYLCFLIATVHATNIKAQQPATFACYYTTNLSGQRLCDDTRALTFNEDVDARDILKKVLSPVGLRPNFVLQPCDSIQNCVATIGDNGWRYILYDRVFLRELVGGASENWSSLSIFAHEVLHHLDQHTHVKNANLERRRQMELDADEWSGRILGMLGATLEQAQSAVRALNLSDEASEFSTHPGKQQRLAAIEKGYNAGVVNTRKPREEINLEDLSMQHHAFLNVTQPERITDFTPTGMMIKQVINIKGQWYAFYGDHDVAKAKSAIIATSLNELKTQIKQKGGFIKSINWWENKWVAIVEDSLLPSAQSLASYKKMDVNTLNMNKAMGTIVKDIAYDNNEWITLEENQDAARIEDQIILMTDAFPGTEISKLWKNLYLVAMCKFINNQWVTILHKYQKDVQVQVQVQGYKTTFPLQEFIKFEKDGYELTSASFDGVYWTYIMNKSKNFTYERVKQ